MMTDFEENEKSLKKNNKVVYRLCKHFVLADEKSDFSAIIWCNGQNCIFEVSLSFHFSINIPYFKTV